VTHDLNTRCPLERESTITRLMNTIVWCLIDTHKNVLAVAFSLHEPQHISVSAHVLVYLVKDYISSRTMERCVFITQQVFVYIRISLFKSWWLYVRFLCKIRC